jgi:hypothetical protein
MSIWRLAEIALFPFSITFAREANFRECSHLWAAPSWQGIF